MWKFYESAFWCGVGVVLMVLGFVAGRFLAGYWKPEADRDRYVEERYTARWLPFFASLALGLIIIGSNVYTMVQVKVAPRVVLVEMVRNLVAGQR